ncbi:MAG: DUF1273 domain-containing protein, partial [Clostridiales bacterium]|nr:DUF1273 domain-containing protein [Clostridiales bacterium]
KKKLRSAAVEAIGRGYKTFISGGGLGFDLYAAAAILDLKREYPYIRLHLALPCMDYQRKWQPEQKKTLETIISQADKTVYVSEQAYFEGCMQLRNKYMVDHANLLIAAYNGSSGGTKNTIAYAEKSFIDIMLLSLEKVEE